MSSLPTLGYWDIRGYAEPIRSLLKYSGVQFNDKRYEFGSEDWNNDKFSLGLDFPNLPYYIDGDIKLSQSLAILRYLGRKHGLVANDEQSLARQDLVEQQIQDIRNGLFDVITEDTIEEKKPNYISEKLVPQLEVFSKFLGENEWLAGKLTYVDFLAYETLDWFRLFSPQTIEKFPNLNQYLNRFESLPSIKTYQSSGEYKNWPLFGPLCKWGYSK